MLEPPRLADDALVAALHAHYGIAAAALTFLPIGADGASWVYRLDAVDGASYFLKLRAGAAFRLPSLAVPHYLAGQGLPHIIAPLPASSGALWADLGDFALILYPLLDARTATDAGLSKHDWRALGATLRRIHTSQLPADLLGMLRREAFVPSRRDVLARLAPAVAGQSFDDLLQRELAAFWRARRDEIGTVLERVDMLGSQLRQESLPPVLCHADLHTWNVLVDAGRHMWIVDWDETVLAPKERDLMFVIRGIGRGLVSQQETACFLQGYGDTPIDQRALAYYRYAWAAQDMGAYAEDVFFSPHLGELSRRASVRSFMSMFEPGNIVAIALDSPL